LRSYTFKRVLTFFIFLVFLLSSQLFIWNIHIKDFLQVFTFSNALRQDIGFAWLLPCEGPYSGVLGTLNPKPHPSIIFLI
jgi:hypothetical protein